MKNKTYYDDEAIGWLLKCSRAELADMVVELIRPRADRHEYGAPGSWDDPVVGCDDPVTRREVRARLKWLTEKDDDLKIFHSRPMRVCLRLGKGGGQ
jgi:hypothetical protein